MKIPPIAVRHQQDPANKKRGKQKNGVVEIHFGRRPAGQRQKPPHANERGGHFRQNPDQYQMGHAAVEEQYRVKQDKYGVVDEHVAVRSLTTHHDQIRDHVAQRESTDHFSFQGLPPNRVFVAGLVGGQHAQRGDGADYSVDGGDGFMAKVGFVVSVELFVKRFVGVK